MVDFLAKLESRAVFEPATGCLLYQGAVWGRNGYGCFWMDGRRMGAHQAAWILRNGPIPEGQKVCHTCDTPLCIADQHLFLATQKENVNDAIKKGRFANSLANLRPENGYKPTVLTAELVREIRTSQERSFILEKRLGLKQQTISAVRRRKIWKSLPDLAV